MKTLFMFASPVMVHSAAMSQLALTPLAPSLADLREANPDRAAAAALLRRATLSPNPGRIDELAGKSWTDMVDEVLNIDRMQTAVEVAVPEQDDLQDVLAWWIEEMSGPENGIVDKMMWFWHGFLTTNWDSVGREILIPRQMTLLRSKSMGNYRDLLQAFVIDGALLRFLDGDGSEASNPNENLGRELMELFTIGRGNYTQDDVRAAARALAGWWVDDDDDREDDPVVRFDRRNAFIAPMIFLGEQADWTTEAVVDRLCDHPGTAVNVASRLWFELVGTDLSTEDAIELGAWWQEADLEILPLVERLLRSDDAKNARYTRARSGLEWYLAVKGVTGLPFDNPWQLESLGQMPYFPPNVAGWPKGDRWLRPGSLVHRAVFLGSVSLEEAPGRTTDDILAASGLESVSDQTRRALEQAGNTSELAADQQARLRWRLALNAPEFHLS